MAYASGAARPLPEDAIARYVIDPKGSSFYVQVFATGLLSAFGHSPRIAIRDFSGDAEFLASGNDVHDARLAITIQSDSLEVADDISTKDRLEIQRQMKEAVLEVDRFPEIQYQCAEVSAKGAGDRYWLTLNGTLALHGVTDRVEVPARLAINGDSFRASGEFSIRQSDFDITPVRLAGGAIRLKDDLKCVFDIVARKQE